VQDPATTTNVKAKATTKTAQDAKPAGAATTRRRASHQRWRDRRALLAAGAVGVVVVVALIAVILHAALDHGPMAGTWVGARQSALADDPASADVYLNLTQSGATVTGTGRVCTNVGGPHQAPISVHGTFQNGTLVLTYDFAGAGIPLTRTPLTLRGPASGDAITLTYGAAPQTVTLRLHHGGTDDFQSLCSHLPASKP